MEKKLKHTPLNDAKLSIKKIEQFVKSRPTPSEYDVNRFIEENELQMFSKYAISLQSATAEKEWILFNHKRNKYR